MSELHPTPDEIEAQLSPESKIRLVEMRAWTALELKRLGIDSDTPEWLDEHYARQTWERLEPHLTDADHKVFGVLLLMERLEVVYNKSQAEDADPIVKFRRSDGEICFCRASKLKPDDDILAGQRMG